MTVFESCAFEVCAKGDICLSLCFYSTKLVPAFCIAWALLHWCGGRSVCPIREIFYCMRWSYIEWSIWTTATYLCKQQKTHYASLLFLASVYAICLLCLVIRLHRFQLKEQRKISGGLFCHRVVDLEAWDLSTTAACKKEWSLFRRDSWNYLCASKQVPNISNVTKPKQCCIFTRPWQTA